MQRAHGRILHLLWLTVVTGLAWLVLLLWPDHAFPQWPGAGWSPAVPNLAHPLLRNLQHWWRAVPGLMGGDKLFDLVPGTLDHLVLTNMGYSTSSGWSAGNRFGSVAQLNFDGTNDYVRGTQGSGPFTDTTPFTLCVWLYPTNFQTGTQVVLGTYDGTGATVWPGIAFWWAQGGSSPKFRIGDTSGFSQEISWTGGSWPMTTGYWQHWCITRTGIGGMSGMTFYWNGAAQTNSTGGNASFGGPFPGTLAWNIGAYCCVATGGYLQGRVDDVMVWVGRALTERELTLVYQQGLIGVPELLPAVPALVAVPGAGAPGGFLPFFR